jgi:two-component system, chemotaxis family, protein-glutamate methylesterase/glutaminase
MENLSKDGALRRRTYEAVVGGVSAGGLDALTSLLSAVTTNFSLAMIIVQHLHPQQNGFLVEHLNRACRLPVKEAEEKEAIKRGTVYLAPANYHLLIEADLTFSLCTDEKVNYSRPSIDVLFETAADAYGARLIGMILTGASKDGAAGLRRIKERAGLAIVQDPRSAEYPAMPLAALAAAQVDHVLTLEGIGRLLCELGSAGQP